LLHISPTLCEYSFGNELKALVNTPSTQASWWSLTGMQVTEWRDGIDAATIAQNFGVGLDTAKWTLKATMQRGVRSVLNPTCSWYFKPMIGNCNTDDLQLMYSRTWCSWKWNPDARILVLKCLQWLMGSLKPIQWLVNLKCMKPCLSFIRGSTKRYGSGQF
jgi:hypothetical protein